MEWRGVTLRGRIDRLDRFDDGSFAVVDYKTGRPPSGAQVAAGYALQLGTLGLMVEGGAFAPVQGPATRFEYWSLAKSKDSDTGFGYVTTPLLEGNKRTGIPPAEFLPEARRYLDEALDFWILGAKPFTARLNPDAPGYATFDQLMRLDEWIGRA
jgi:ATP-dependent helicase/nuclease subunit B